MGLSNPLGISYALKLELKGRDMRDPQLVSIEFQVAQMSRRIFCNSGNSYERYVHRFSQAIYLESKRRISPEREMLIDTATKHGFDEDIIRLNTQSEKSESDLYSWPCSSNQEVQ